MGKGKGGVVLPNVEDRAEFMPLVKEILQREVTNRQRQVLMLLYMEGLSVSGCAKRLSVSPSTVCRTRDRGLSRLRRYLRYGMKTAAEDA